MLPSYVRATNRAQQAYRLENPSFANAYSKLKIDIPSQSSNYSYSISATTNSALVTANATDPKLMRSFVGYVTVGKNGTSIAVACQTTGPGPASLIQIPTLSPDGSSVSCAAGSEPMQ